MNAWLKGLLAALLGGAAGMAGQSLNNRMTYGNAAPPITVKNMGIPVCIGAALTGIAYLLQSPLPVTEVPPVQVITTVVEDKGV